VRLTTETKPEAATQWSTRTLAVAGVSDTTIQRLWKARGLKPQVRCITDSVRVISTLIRGHQAVGVLPEYGCEALLADRRLRATLLPRRRDVWLLVQNHLKRDPAARTVIDWLRECFEGYAKR